VETGGNPPKALLVHIYIYSCYHINAFRSWFQPGILFYFYLLLFIYYFFFDSKRKTSVLKILGGVFIFPLYSVGYITSLLSPIFQIIAFMLQLFKEFFKLRERVLSSKICTCSIFYLLYIMQYISCTHYYIILSFF
jgi:hypothetical protein